MNVALLLRGHAFRQGNQFQHVIPESTAKQEHAAKTQWIFVDRLRQLGVRVDVFCCAYETEWDLAPLYPGAEINIVRDKHRMSQGDMLCLAWETISPIDSYDHVIVTRFDLTLKQPDRFGTLVHEALRSPRTITYLFPLTTKLHNHRDGSWYTEVNRWDRHWATLQSFNDLDSLPPKVPDAFYIVPRSMYEFIRPPYVGNSANHGFLQRIRIVRPDVAWDHHFLSDKESDDDPAKITNPFYDFSSRESVGAPTPKIHFVSFHTEDLTRAKDVYEPRIRPFVDTCRFFTDAEMRGDPASRIMVKVFDTPAPMNPGCHTIAYWRWKPYIILKTMEGIPDGDLVYYRDCNVIKCPNILAHVEDTREIVHKVLRDTDLFVPIENETVFAKQHCKREVFEAFGVADDRKYADAHLRSASIVICRKSLMSIQILSTWLQYCMSDHLIDHIPRVVQHPEFKWNTGDQPILNVFLQKLEVEHGFKIPRYVLDNRAMSLNMRSL